MGPLIHPPAPAAHGRGISSFFARRHAGPARSRQLLPALPYLPPSMAVAATALECGVRLPLRGSCIPAHRRAGPTTRSHAGSALARLGYRRPAGFTLFELIVIILILTVVIGLVGLNLTRDASDQLKDEAQRLAMVLQAAEEEAILNGRVYVVALARDGYQVLTPDDKGKLGRISNDELYRPYRLPDGMTISAASIDGVPAVQGRADILVDPSGLLPAFTVDFSAGEIRWRLEGLANGTTRTERLS